MSMETLDVETKIESRPPKTIGLFSAFTLQVGNVIGSSIYMIVGITMKATPPSVGFVILFWALGGMVSLVGGLCYAELGGLIPKSGGERTYLAESFGYRFGVTFTYVYVLLIKGMMFAGLAIATGCYFVEIFLPNNKNTETPTILVAYVALFAVFLINVVSTKLANIIQIFFTVAKMLALGLIIVTGVAFMIRGESVKLEGIFTIDEFHPRLLSTAIMIVLWCYDGWNYLGAIVGDMKNPARNLPIAIGLGMFTVTVLYVATIFSYVVVLGYDTVSNSQTVAVLFAEKFGRANFIIPIFICCSTLGAYMSGMIPVAKVALVSGYEGDIPKIFSLVRRTSRTPVVSLFLILLASCCFVPTQFEVLIGLIIFVQWIFYFLVMLSLVYFKFKRTDLIAKFKVPVKAPIFMMLVSAFMVGVSFYNNVFGCSCLFAIVVMIFVGHSLPDKILKPVFLVNLHNRFCDKLIGWFDLSFADETDIS